MTQESTKKPLSESPTTSLSPVAQALTQLPVTPLAPDTAPEEKSFADSVEELRSALIPEILEEHPGLTRQALEKDLEQWKAKAASAAGTDLASEVQQAGDLPVLVKRLDGQDGKALLALMDQLKNKLGSAIVLLGGELDGKVVLVAGVTKDLTSRVKAGDLIRNTAAAVGGKGGGRPDMAQGGGADPAALDAALAEALGWLQQQ